MHLIQLLLPLYGNDGAAFAKPMFDRVRRELTGRFGGVTLYVRSPAVGAWQDDAGTIQRDEVILLEVMADAIDAAWWTAYRGELEQRFGQDEILVRATQVQRL